MVELTVGGCDAVHYSCCFAPGAGVSAAAVVVMVGRLLTVDTHAVRVSGIVIARVRVRRRDVAARVAALVSERAALTAAAAAAVVLTSCNQRTNVRLMYVHIR